MRTLLPSRNDLRACALIAASGAVLAAAFAARAQTLAGALLLVETPFFAAGGGGSPMTGGAISLTGALGGGAVAPMSGGTLSLAPGVMAAQPMAEAGIGFVHAFPIPFQPSQGHDRITFRGLTTTATIKVYTLTGRLVATLRKDDPTSADLIWTPVSNSAGQPLASGTYVYFVTGASGKATGKIMVIR